MQCALMGFGHAWVACSFRPVHSFVWWFPPWRSFPFDRVILELSLSTHHNFSPTQNSTQNSTIMAQNRAKNAPKNKAKTPRKRAKKVLGDAELAAKLLKKERQREAEVARVLKANAEHLKATRTSAPPIVAPRTKPFVTTNHLAHVRVGERAQAKANTSPGCNRPAGSGYVQLVAGAGAETVVSVKHDAVHGGLLHHDVPHDDITVMLFRQEFLQPNLAAGRAKRAVPVVDEPAVDSGSDRRHPICDLLERLNDGCSSGKPKGFHRAELGLGKQPGSKQMTDAEKGRLFAEVMCLRQHLDSKPDRHHFRQGSDGRTLKRQSKHDPESIRHLVQVGWGKSNSHLSNLEKVAKKRSGGGPVCCFPTSADDSSDSAAFRSVIDDLATVTRRCAAPCLFAIAKCREQAKVDHSVLSSAEHGARFSGWMKAHGALPASEKAMWEMKRRSHLAVQPHIRDVVVGALMRNPRESWRELEVDVNFWCSCSAMRRWTMSREGFRCHAERIIPLLATHIRWRNIWHLRGNSETIGGSAVASFSLLCLMRSGFGAWFFDRVPSKLQNWVLILGPSRHVTEITSTSAWWWLSLPWLLLTALRMAALRSSLDFFGLRRIKLRGRW